MCSNRHAKRLDRGLDAAQARLSYDNEIGEFLENAGLEKYIIAFRRAGIMTIGDLIVAVDMDDARTHRRKMKQVRRRER